MTPELLDITEDKETLVFVSPFDSLNHISVRVDRSIVTEKVLKPTDQFLSVITKNKIVYGLFQTIIGELNLGVWNMDFSLVTIISRLSLRKVRIKDCRS